MKFDSLKTDAVLRGVILSTLLLMVTMNLFFAWILGGKLSVHSADMISALEARLEVTPREVMEKLEVINAKQDANIARILQALEDASP